MKRHYIYFIILPLMLFLALCMPFTISRPFNGVEHITNSFDDGFTWIVYTVPTLIATVLLLIRNRVTALLGAIVYFLSLCLSVFMNIVLQNGRGFEKVGFGARLILVVMLAGAIVGILHTVKLYRARNLKPKKNSEVLDDVF
ncbi:MAG: hypothetical protein AB8B56_21370 [Crocinitomicaceae bacterium]